MRRAIALTLGASALAAALWWWLPTSKQRLHNNKESPNRLIGALPPSSPATRNTMPVPAKAVKDVDLSLDRIVGASVQRVSNLLAGRSREEIARLVQQLQSLKFGGLSNAKIALVFKAWAQLAPQDALQAALSFRNNWAKTQALQSILDGMNPDAAPGLVNSLVQTADGDMSGSLKQQLITIGVTKWSQIDPAGAAKFLDSSSVQLSAETWRQVAENWAVHDPKLALDWVRGQADAEVSRTSDQP